MRALLLTASIACMAEPSAAQVSNEAVKASFLRAVSACQVAMSTAGRFASYMPSTGKWMSVQPISTEVLGADAVSTTSIISPWAGWVKVKITSAGALFETEQDALAADPRPAGRRSEYAYTVRMSWADGRWVLEGAEGIAGREPYRMSAEQLVKNPATAHAACALAMTASK
jgi:hypothetical protein